MLYFTVQDNVTVDNLITDERNAELNSFELRESKIQCTTVLFVISRGVDNYQTHYLLDSSFYSIKKSMFQQASGCFTLNYI